MGEGKRTRRRFIEEFKRNAVEVCARPVGRSHGSPPSWGSMTLRFPGPESVIRLVGALLVEVNDELIAEPRRYMAAATLTPLLTDTHDQLPSLPAAPRT